MWPKILWNRLPGSFLILFSVSHLWQVPGHIESARWWSDQLVMLQDWQFSWALLAVGILLFFRPEVAWLLRCAIRLTVRLPRPKPSGAAVADVVEEERIFTKRSAGELFASAVEMTELQMEHFVKPHIGKWIRVQSFIQDMRTEGAFVTVWIGGKFEPTPILQFQKDVWLGHLETMRRGEILAACGKIQSVGLMTMVLVDCEIVDVEGENDAFRRPSPRGPD